MSKHVHAELMMQYAQDAMETDKPWERWECFSEAAGTWFPLCYELNFSTHLKYRRKEEKPKTKTVYLWATKGRHDNWFLHTSYYETEEQLLASCITGVSRPEVKRLDYTALEVPA